MARLPTSFSLHYVARILLFLYLIQLLGAGMLASGEGSGYATWTLLDSSTSNVSVVGKDIGRLEGQDFAGWYTSTVVVDNDTGIAVIAWVRQSVGSQGNDYIYIAFLRPVDADGDGRPEAYGKVLKYVGRDRDVELDSLVLGEAGGEKYVLLTWTSYNGSYRNDVKAAIYRISDGSLQWSGVIESTTAWEEYSRACYLPVLGNEGGFLVVWYTSSDESIDGRTLYYDNGEWVLSKDKIDIADTNHLYYTKADQMLCIGGREKALVVYRKWNSADSSPGLYAALVGIEGIQEIELWDDKGEETIGVNGAYTYHNGDGYFLVPLISGESVRYDVVRESDGTVYHRDYVASRGEHPYAIALGDRFMLAWIDRSDDDGEPKIANIDLENFYIHPKNGVSVASDQYTDKHPLIAYSLDDGKTFYVWSSLRGEYGYDIEYAIIDPRGPLDSPIVEASGPLLNSIGDQVAHGIGLVSLNEYVIAYTEALDYTKDSDLLAYVELPGAEQLGSSSAQLFFLPRDAEDYEHLVKSLITSADKEIYIAMAFWREGSEPCENESTIAYSLVAKYHSKQGMDVRVIMDNSTSNSVVKNCLIHNEVPVIDDSSASDANHIMHNKFMVVDGSRLVVATVNFVASDFYRNNNTAIYIESRSVAYFYREEFLHMWNDGAGRFGSQKIEDHSFIAFTVYNGRVVVFEGYFSPQQYGDWGRIPNTIAGFMRRAHSGIYFASYIFTTSGWVKPVYIAVAEAIRDRGVPAIAVFDEGLNVDTPGRRLYWLIDNGSRIAIDTHPYRMHAKLFVVDNTTAILGSWNPTRSATLVHDENVLVVRDPDIGGGIARQLASYILSMYSDGDHFARSPYQYNPPHPVITKVYYYPDTSGQPDAEWVEVYNPTSHSIDLGYYVIGDAENLINGDDEALYRFPPGSSIAPQSFIVVAYSAENFYQKYGFKPDYEIVDTDPDVPNLQPYDTSRFTGQWSLEDSGDEVILARISGNGFLEVVDAVWWGNSSYMTGSEGRPSSAMPVDTSQAEPGDAIVDKYLLGDSQYPDAVKMADKYELQYEPQPIPEPSYTALAAILALLATIAYIAAISGKRYRR